MTYHGPHVASPQRGYQTLTWRAPTARCDRDRVRQHTCWCRMVTYELCMGGGLLYIRRTYSQGGKTSVQESDRWRAAVGEDTWRLLMCGQAC